MKLEDMLADSSADWVRCPPASEDDIQWLLQHIGLELQPGYITALRYSNGGDGEFHLSPYGSFSPGWFQLWPISEVLQTNGQDCIHEDLPGYYAFGGNGGGEFFAFDTRTPHPWRIVMFPYLHSGEKDGIVIALSFEEFVAGMGRKSEDDDKS